MTAITSGQVISRTTAGVTPVPITPAASDTVPAALFGPTGLTMRLITTGTSTTLTVGDPTKTALGNPGTPTGVVAAATGVQEIFIPTAAIDPVTQVATLNFSGARTGVSYELSRA